MEPVHFDSAKACFICLDGFILPGSPVFYVFILQKYYFFMFYLIFKNFHYFCNFIGLRGAKLKIFYLKMNLTRI